MTRLRIGVVGVGHLGKEHARILSGLPEVELVGVVDTSPAQAQAIAEKCQTKAFTDYRDLIPLVQAAVIVVPTAYHHEVATAYLRAGVPVLVEKPFAPTVAQADAVLTLARQRGLVLQVGHIERFNPAFEELQRRPLVPKYIRAERNSGFSGRSTDVGVVMDMMIHDLDLVLALVKSPVTRVEALGVAVLNGNEDIAHATVHFVNGAVASLSANRVSAEPSRKMQVTGSEGFAVVDFAKKTVTLTQRAEHLRDIDSRTADAATLTSLRTELFTRHLETQTLDRSGGDQLTAELRDFISAVTTGGTPRVDGVAGRDAVALAQQIVSALNAHCWDARHVGPRQLPASNGVLFVNEAGKQAA